jgi:hypothetical protein
MLLNNLNYSTRPKLSDAAVKNRNSAVAKVKKHRVVLINNYTGLHFESHQKLFAPF